MKAKAVSRVIAAPAATGLAPVEEIRIASRDPGAAGRRAANP